MTIKIVPYFLQISSSGDTFKAIFIVGMHSKITVLLSIFIIDNFYQLATLTFMY